MGKDTITSWIQVTFEMTISDERLRLCLYGVPRGAAYPPNSSLCVGETSPVQQVTRAHRRFFPCHHPSRMLATGFCMGY